MTQPTTAKEVAEFHRLSDVDKQKESQHHRIGLGTNQVAPGKHYHNGQDSPPLLSDFNFTGSRSTNTAAVLAQVLTALTQLGALDGTTA